MKTTKRAGTLVETLIVLLTLSTLFVIVGNYIVAAVAKLEDRIENFSDQYEEVIEKIESGERIGDLDTDQYDKDIDQAITDFEDLQDQINQEIEQYTEE